MVRENLSLEKMQGWALAPLHQRRERAHARDLLNVFNVDIDPDRLVSELTLFEQSAVAIARALGAVGQDATLLVLDEPTAALGAQDARRLIETLETIRELGVAILYVSHYLGEILSFADRISVLRDGRLIAVRDVHQTDEDDLVELIVGRAVERVAPAEAESQDTGPAPLEVRELSGPALRNVSFRARTGEVLGLTGLTGSGFDVLASCLGGHKSWDSGQILVDGVPLKPAQPRNAIARGIVLMPSDRLSNGLIPQFSLSENITLPRIGGSWHRGLLREATEAEEVTEWLHATGVVPPEPRLTVAQLSGGNQQKVLLAKCLRLQPRILVLCEPTQAVDVGGAAAIRAMIVDAGREPGRTVVVASSDADELEQICNRVLVMRGGSIVCELTGGDITKERLLAESAKGSS